MTQHIGIQERFEEYASNHGYDSAEDAANAALKALEEKEHIEMIRLGKEQIANGEYSSLEEGIERIRKEISEKYNITQ